MGLEHPAITRTLRTGYHKPEPEIFGVDFKGNTVFVGDEILATDRMFFLLSDLSDTEIQVLEEQHAIYAVASN